MKRCLFTSISIMVLLAVSHAWSMDDAFRNDPGYFDLHQLDKFAVEGEAVDISVEQPLLAIAAGAVTNGDPGLSEMLSGIQRIGVRHFKLREQDKDDIRKKVQKLEEQMRSDDWRPVIRVTEEGEQVTVSMKYVSQRIEGIAIVAVEYGSEATLINVMGRIDAAAAGKLIKGVGNLDDGSLKDLMENLGKELDLEGREK